MDITKLDLNWGGAGYPAYDGRLEDGDGETMDSQDRAEAALAAFTGDEGQQQDDGDQQQQDEGQGGEEQQQGGEQQQVEGQLTDEQLQADPRYAELSTFRDEVSAVFDKHGLAAAAEANGRTPHEEADLQLSDANILYSIMRGEATPSRLLDTMVQVGNWQKEQRDAVAADLMSWLTKAGYIKGDQAAAGAAAAPGAKDGALKDPLEERISKMESAHERSVREAQERTVQVERDRVSKIFIDHVTKLATDAGVHKDDVVFYLTQVGALVNGNPAITKRVGQNNFVDVKKFFDTVHNRELDRLKRFNEAQLKKQSAKARNPKSTTGGGPGAPAGQAKRNVGNRDDRIAAAAEMLTGN